MESANVAEWFGSRLRELRMAKGWTQAELATEAKISKAGIADIEQGRNAPSWPTVLALCAALGCKCDAFQEKPADADSPGRGRPKKEEAKPTSKKKTKGK